MIRRHAENEFWLITQDDHAALSGQLARQLGNDAFEPPSSESALRGIALHDCGWPIHDDGPTLNSDGLPLDVFETPRELGLRVWTESAESAAARDDYAGLLVSLHGLALSVFASAQQSPAPSDRRWDMNDPRARFELNRFQHRMIELQESLRQRLGMRTDRPLRHGMAEESPDLKERRLVRDFRWLQAMDRLSLSICCTVPPFPTLGPVVPRLGAAPISIQVTRGAGLDVELHPWPFAQDRLEATAPFRRIPATQYQDEPRFRAVYDSAAIERFTAVVRRRTI